MPLPAGHTCAQLGTTREPAPCSFGQHVGMAHALQSPGTARSPAWLCAAEDTAAVGHPAAAPHQGPRPLQAFPAGPESLPREEQLHLKSHPGFEVAAHERRGGFTPRCQWFPPLPVPARAGNAVPGTCIRWGAAAHGGTRATCPAPDAVGTVPGCGDMSPWSAESTGWWQRAAGRCTRKQRGQTAVSGVLSSAGTRRR